MKFDPMNPAPPVTSMRTEGIICTMRARAGEHGISHAAGPDVLSLRAGLRCIGIERLKGIVVTGTEEALRRTAEVAASSQ